MILKSYDHRFSNICVFGFLIKMFIVLFIIKSTNANKSHFRIIFDKLQHYYITASQHSPVQGENLVSHDHK